MTFKVKTKGQNEGEKLLKPKLRFKEFKDNWTLMSLNSLMEFKNGINATKDAYGKGIKYISVTDILNNNFITYEKIKGLVNIDNITLKNNSVTYGDVVFQRSSETIEDIGRANVYLDHNKVATFGGFVIRGKKKGDYNPLFINYLLQNSSSRKAIIVKGAGAQHYNISQEELEKIELYFPSIEEQEKIAAILCSLDDKIELNNKIKENLECQAQAFYQDLFIDNANPEWPQGTVNDLGTVVGGSTPPKSKPEYYTENGIPWITPKDLSVNKAKFIFHGENDITELGLKNSSATIMPEGTVLFSSRAPIGYIAIAAGEVTTNQGFKSVVPKPEIGTAFVYYFLKQNLPIIEGMASGSTFKEVSGSTMKRVPAVIPDSETLDRFNSSCKLIFAQQQILEEQNHSLAALRDGLLPKLMSGKIEL